MSSGSVRASLRTSTPKLAASAASGPGPRPPSTPIRAPVPFTSTAIERSPQTYWPGSGRDLAAHSIGPSRPCSAIVRNPFPHLDHRPLTRGRFHDHAVHQPAGARQAEAQAAAGRIAVLHCSVDVGDARTVVFGPHHQCLSTLANFQGDPDGPEAGIAGDVAGDF